MGLPDYYFAIKLGHLLPGVEFTQNPFPGYPAAPAPDALTDPATYFGSASSGATQLVEMVVAEAKACPKTEIVLAGYSQGAEASGDAYLTLLRTSKTRASKIVGLVLFGDPLYNHSDPGDVSSLPTDGVLTSAAYGTVSGGLRRKPHSFPTSPAHVISICHDNDLICQGAGQTASYLLSKAKSGTYLSNPHDYADTSDPATAANLLYAALRAASKSPVPPVPSALLWRKTGQGILRMGIPRGPQCGSRLQCVRYCDFYRQLRKELGWPPSGVIFKHTIRSEEQMIVTVLANRARLLAVTPSAIKGGMKLLLAGYTQMVRQGFSGGSFPNAAGAAAGGAQVEQFQQYVCGI